MGREEQATRTNSARVDWRLSRSEWSRLYIICLGLMALGFFVFLEYTHFHPFITAPSWPFSWSGLFLLVAVALFAEKYSIRVRPGLEVSATFLAFILSAALIGPIAGFITGALSPLLLLERRDPFRPIWYASLASLVAGGTGLCYWAMLGWVTEAGNESAVAVAAVGVAAGVIFQVLNFVLVAPIYWLRRGRGPVVVWREAFQPFLPFHFFFLAISLGLIYIYRVYVLRPGGVSTIYSSLLIMLCLLPVLGLIYAFRAYAHQRELAQHNARLALRNERLFLQAVKSQVTALDIKDNYTARHSAAVARWATDIAQGMALSKHEQNIAHLASLVHDVGKIGVPDEVLNYPGRLESAPWALIEAHCQNGHRILKTIDQFGELAEVILYHHERYDGSGYPVGLIGENIPLLSRIICVADSYSAMVSDRPYRKALPAEVAQGELRKHAGSQFDPVVVEHFLKILGEHDGAYQRGELADFDLEFSSDRFLRELPHESVEAEPGIAVSPAKS